MSFARLRWVVGEAVGMGPMPCGDQLFETDPAEPVPPRARGDVPVDKTFRVYDQDQSFLMPPSLRDWLAPSLVCGRQSRRD